MDVGMHNAKNRRNKEAILSSTIMRNPSLHNSGKGLRMIVLVSLIVLLRGFPCFHVLRMVHPYIHIHSIE